VTTRKGYGSQPVTTREKVGKTIYGKNKGGIPPYCSGPSDRKCVTTGGNGEEHRKEGAGCIWGTRLQSNRKGYKVPNYFEAIKKRKGTTDEKEKKLRQKHRDEGVGGGAPKSVKREKTGEKE